MIDRDLTDGPGSPLVRGFAACLSSMTETTDDELPLPPADEPLPTALGGWKTWLAGRGAGLVPIADPRSFQWAGWWIAVVDGSSSPLAGGPQRQVAALAFGTPPGIVLSPQDPVLLGEPTATLPISSAFAVASLDPVLPPVRPARALAGDVLCRGHRLAEPCAHLERLAGPGLLRGLIHRGGLRADVLTDGVVHLGSLVTTVPRDDLAPGPAAP